MVRGVLDRWGHGTLTKSGENRLGIRENVPQYMGDGVLLIGVGHTHIVLGFKVRACCGGGE